MLSHFCLIKVRTRVENLQTAEIVAIAEQWVLKALKLEPSNYINFITYWARTKWISAAKAEVLIEN